MTKDISNAFDHPEARAVATSGSAPRDRISLRDHVIEVEIGAFQSERGTRQRVCFNIVVEVRPGQARVDDDVDRILSYDRITEAIQTEVFAQRVNLLETLAERIAERILTEPRAMRVFVRIEKLDRGPGALGVEIVRSHDDVASDASVMAAPALAPQIVYLTNMAIASDRIGTWLDQLQGQGVPVVLCVGLPDEPRPQSDVPAAQRRIDLAAIEQNAWVLAGRDRRCVVMSARTEIDWALKHGQMLVWSPAKMVLDTASAPQGTVQPKELAEWLARELNAVRTLELDAVSGSGNSKYDCIPDI